MLRGRKQMTIGFRHEALFYDSPTGFADTHLGRIGRKR